MQRLTRRKLLMGAAVALVPAVSRSARADAAELKFIISKDSSGKFRWKLVSGNGQTVATPGQGYTTKQSCRDGIELIKQNAASATIDDRTKTKP